MPSKHSDPELQERANAMLRAADTKGGTPEDEPWVMTKREAKQLRFAILLIMFCVGAMSVAVAVVFKQHKEQPHGETLFSLPAKVEPGKEAPPKEEIFKGWKI